MAISISVRFLLCALVICSANFRQNERRKKKNTRFRVSKIVSIVCPKVTHWWCRLFIKLNSCSVCVCAVFYGTAINSVRGFFSWMRFPTSISFVWLKTSLINFNTNLVIWFNLCFVCGRNRVSPFFYCFFFHHFKCDLHELSNRSYSFFSFKSITYVTIQIFYGFKLILINLQYK